MSVRHSVVVGGTLTSLALILIGRETSVRGADRGFAWLNCSSALAWAMLNTTSLVVTLTLAWSIAAASPSWADFQARVMAVHEGDRLTLYHKGKNEMVYLQDVDCPDLKQPYGKQAKRATGAISAGARSLCAGSSVTPMDESRQKSFFPMGATSAMSC
jgi:hypothetical protein